MNMENSTSHDSIYKLDDSLAFDIAGKIIVSAIFALFLVVVFVLFLRVYARRYRRRHSRRHFVFSPAAQDQNRQGLDSSVLKSLPVIVFRTGTHKDGLECAVCLSELVDGEKARMLPKCNHGFHVDCIDMWFQSHSTCPLCRNSVIDVSDAPASILPTNVLFWGDGEGTSGSSSSSGSNRPDGMLVIDIPRQAAAEIFSPRSPVDQETKTPVSSRWRSFKRMLSMDTRGVACTCGSSSSSNSVDVEQGRS